MVCGPRSSTRLISTKSFQAGRTIGVAVPRCTACNCGTRSATSLGECSVSSRIQSKPLSDKISAPILLARLLQMPICSLPAAIAALNSLRCSSIGLTPHTYCTASAPSGPKSAWMVSPLLTQIGADEGAGQQHLARRDFNAVAAEAVGEPGDAQRRMAHDAERQAGLLDIRVAVEHAADPAQIEVERLDRPPADHQPRRGAVVGDRVENLARILHARVDQLHRRHDIFGGAHHLHHADARTLERLVEDEHQFDLDARRAVIRVVHLGAVGHHHGVEEMTVIRLVDLRRGLHRLRGQADLVADNLGALRHLVLDDEILNRIGVVEIDVRPSLRRLHHLPARFLGGQQRGRGILPVGLGHHRRASSR